MTSSLSCDGYPLNVVYFLFGSPVHASAVSYPIFEIKATEYKTNISTPMFSGSGKNVVSFGYLAVSAFPKISGGGLADSPSTSGSGGFKFGSST